MKQFICLLGYSESHRYTIDAEDEENLKRILAKTWPSLYDGEWTEQNVGEGYPEGYKRFIVSNKYGREKACWFPEKN